jgi:hypothetical protein
MSTILKTNGFRHSQCVVLKRHVGPYVESKLTNVESKLLVQLLLCGFDICLFLFDRTAKIDPTEVSICRGSFGGFESTCFQLDRAARIETTRISYFSCDRSAPITTHVSLRGRSVTTNSRYHDVVPAICFFPCNIPNKFVGPFGSRWKKAMYPNHMRS